MTARPPARNLTGGTAFTGGRFRWGTAGAQRMPDMGKIFSVYALHRRVGNAALFPFLLGLAMSIFAIATALQLRVELRAAFSELHDTREMQQRSSRILLGLVDTETALRGYLLSADSEMLRPYRRAADQIPHDIAQITALAEGETEIMPVLRRFVDRSTELLGTISARIAAAERLSGNLASWRPFVAEMATRLDQLRILNADLDGRLSLQLRTQETAVERITVTLLLTIATLLLGVILVSFTQARELVAQTLKYIKAERHSHEVINDLSSSVTRTREELQASHLRLSLALRAAHVQVFSVASGVGITSITDETSGLVQGVQLPADIVSVADPRDQARVAGILAEAREADAAVDFEMRTIGPDGGVLWFKISLTPSDFTSAGEILGTAFDITELKNREERNFWLLRELSHRSKNLLAIIQAMARQTSRTAASPAEFQQRFAARLRAMAAAHDLLVKTSYSGAGLAQLVASQLGDLAVHLGGRIRMEGPPVLLRPEATQNIAMALHELAANAGAHGALAGEDGSIAISWAIEGQGAAETLVLNWTEMRSEPAPRPAADGFGTTIIVRTLAQALEGTVSLLHPSGGTRCRMAFPMRLVRAGYALASPTPPA